MKVFIGYISLSGNTEKMALKLQGRLAANGCKVDIERLDTIETETLKGYDVVLIGSYTWNQYELPYEAIEFYEELSQTNIAGVKVACFGSDDFVYTNAFTAIDMFVQKLKELGANVYSETLKINQRATTYNKIMRCEQFADQVLIWGRNRKKWRLISRNGVLNIPHFIRSASL